MANNLNNGIGCQAGRTKIVDPNDFSGFNSESNMSVPLEDLNISVVLKTYKKARTVLMKEGSTGSYESTKEVAINFIEGSDINGNKVLTTKYTDLTTVFEKGTINSETLGITNIDIDFNSSYAPMVTINFIDVRGSSIFQNDEGIAGSGGGNKYATFFQIPYPIFELEVKGYYGKPVTYCLHMLKFNSKFNSQTGNFEIQCDFIGYTYAMLSDLLMGYLKAIPFTTIGEAKYAKYDENRPNKEPILTLVELMQKISVINGDIKKTTIDSDNAKKWDNAKEALDTLDRLEQNINSLSSVLQNISTKSENIDKSLLIVRDMTDLNTNQKVLGIDTFKTDTENNVKTFNDYEMGAVLNAEDFKNFEQKVDNGGKYTEVSKDLFLPTDSTRDSEITTKTGPQKDLTNFKTKTYNYLEKYYDVVGDVKLVIYNMNSLFDKIDEARVIVEKNGEDAKKGLANELKEKVAEILGFEPTVRNIVEIFTAAAEVFMETIYDVSTSAEKKDNVDRIAELKSVFSTDKSYDLPSQDTFYAWPDYKEKVEKIGYVQKYLGAKGVLTHPDKVDELLFIDDLLAAFIKAKKAEDEIGKELENEEKSWFPVNPIDSIIYNSTDPYTRVEFKNHLDVMRLAVIRGMTFLGYTNDYQSLSPAEMKAMGEAEADAILRGVKDAKIKQALVEQAKSETALDGYVKVEGKGAFNEDTPVIKALGDGYYYQYIFDGGNPDTFMIIPINNGFEGYWPFADPDQAPSGITELNQRAENGEYLFLTNWSCGYSNSSDEFFNKWEDGGIYVKILTKAEYSDVKATLYTLPNGMTSDSKLILEGLKEDIVADAPTSGFNVFGGPFGIQDFSLIDCGGGDDGPNGMPMPYLFYSNDSENIPNGLSGKRMLEKTDYDFKGKQMLADNKNDIWEFDGTTLRENIGKNRDFLSSPNTDDVSYPYFEQPAFDTCLTCTYTNDVSYRNVDDENSFSLFGSKFYYAQSKSRIKQSDGNLYDSSEYAKAFLFLNNLPFNKGFDACPFNNNEIKHLFDTRGGFIHAPRLFCAYVGSILWRLSSLPPEITNGKITGGGAGPYEGTNDGDPIVWTKNGVDILTYLDAPNRDQYLTWLDWGEADLSNYKEIDTPDDILWRLPIQVKKEFKRMFFEFVNGDGEYSKWETIKEQMEIFKGNSTQFNVFFDTVRNAAIASSNCYDFYTPNWVFTNPLFQNGKDGKSYVIISPFYISDCTVTWDHQEYHEDYLFLEMAGTYKDNIAQQTLINAMKEEVVIVNTGWNIWGSEYVNDEPVENAREEISCSKTAFDTYFKGLTEKLKAVGDEFSEREVNNQILNELFGTANEDTIKLLLYKHCKNIHDKWLAGATDPDKLMFQCGNKRNSTDKGLAEKYGNLTPRFIDTFRFVSRSFEDIGDLLYINPLPINNYLVENQNTCLYDSVSTLLNDNKFDFIALPTFVNFHDDEELKSIFKPYDSYEKAVAEGSCGPSFVCVYVGEKSKHLAIANADYPNDSFDLRCINNSLVGNVPEDFMKNSEAINGQFYEDPVGVFTVKYSQQNQNVFKDIVLDQSEFTETEESLQIIDDISQKGSETNRSLAGQNLYNVYSLRSYTAQVEMMGNAMIQPMMYFQLDNIPMFHGAYMVTRVKHSIKPNTMSTNFTGVRIKYSKTPLVEAMDVYMDLLDTLDTSQAKGGGSALKSGSYAPIVKTLIENGSLNSNIESPNGNIAMANIGDIPGISFVLNPDRRLLAEAAKPLEEMLKDWAKWMSENGFKVIAGTNVYAYVTSLFRVNTYNSPHGWGIAVDLQMFDKSGKIFPNTNETGSKAEYFSFKTNPALQWLYQHSYEYGYVQPYWANNGEKVGKKAGEEHWHWEYHGKSAICMLRKRPIPALGNNSASDNPVSEIKESKIKSFVKNPKGKDNKEAVYTGCDYLTVKASDYANMDGGTVIEGGAADYWALVAICSMENGTAQGRCDVAQSIYNRLASKKYNGDSIKALIVAKNQYEPVERAVAEFNAINSKNTAIKAVQKSKSYTLEQATTAIDNTINALKDPTLIQNSAAWVEGRTDFYSESIKDQIPSNGIGLKTRDGQVFGWFVGPGSIAYGNTSPSPATFSASS
jgi:hypothetical protein